MLYCKFPGECDSERILKIGQYVTKLCVDYVGAPCTESESETERNESQSIRALSVSSCQAAWLLSHWDAGRYQGSCYNVVDNMVPCCLAWCFFCTPSREGHVCQPRRYAATGVGDTGAAAETQGDSHTTASSVSSEDSNHSLIWSHFTQIASDNTNMFLQCHKNS